MSTRTQTQSQHASHTPAWLESAAWAVSGLAAIAVCVLWLDRPVATWSHAVLHRPAAAVLITKLAELPVIVAIALGTLAAYLGMRLAGRPLGRGWHTAVAAASSALLAVAAVMLLKYAAGRLWPETWAHHNPSWIGTGAYGFYPFHGGQGWGSFPSGHTARVTAPFAVLWQRLPRLRLAWALPPSVMAAALIACDYHFLGDCVAGAYLGVGAAALVLFLTKRL
jgi:membrane-associated phospholipid phosphatase